MPALSKTAISEYSPAEIYAIVADIEKYPEFLPWCVALRVLERKENILVAEMLISFKLYTEKFKSRVQLFPPENNEARIEVELIEGPFAHLENKWKFYKNGEKNMVEFAIDFRMKSAFLEKMVALMFEPAVNKMAKAFEQRAKEVYSG